MADYLSPVLVAAIAIVPSTILAMAQWKSTKALNVKAEIINTVVGKQEVAAAKQDSAATKIEEIHSLTDGNLSKVTALNDQLNKDLTAANTRIDELYNMVKQLLDLTQNSAINRAAAIQSSLKPLDLDNELL